MDNELKSYILDCDLYDGKKWHRPGDTVQMTAAQAEKHLSVRVMRGPIADAAPIPTPPPADSDAGATGDAPIEESTQDAAGAEPVGETEAASAGDAPIEESTENTAGAEPVNVTNHVAAEPLDADAILHQATFTGVVEKSGSWFRFEGIALGNGRAKALETLQADAELRERIRSKLAEITP